MKVYLMENECHIIKQYMSMWWMFHAMFWFHVRINVNKWTLFDGLIGQISEWNREKKLWKKWNGNRCSCMETCTRRAIKTTVTKSYEVRTWVWFVEKSKHLFAFPKMNEPYVMHFTITVDHLRFCDIQPIFEDMASKDSGMQIKSIHQSEEKRERKREIFRCIWASSICFHFGLVSACVFFSPISPTA